MKKEVTVFAGVILALALMQAASAGVGIKWDQESFLVNEGARVCLTYGVYNPWPDASNVQIVLPDNLKTLLISQEAETKLIPANTPSSAAIPVEFCFKVPQIYAKNCLIGGFLCSQECKEEQKVYEGQVSVVSVPGSEDIIGSGGSATQASVAAPLRLKIVCNPHSTDFSLLYMVLGVVAVIGIVIILFRKYRKPEAERKKEKLDKLKEEMKELKGKK